MVFLDVMWRGRCRYVGLNGNDGDTIIRRRLTVPTMAIPTLVYQASLPGMIKVHRRRGESVLERFYLITVFVPYQISTKIPSLWKGGLQVREGGTSINVGGRFEVKE